MIAAYDKTLFYNDASKYSVLRLKTADPMVPEDARDKYKFNDHLIRFVAVGYDLPRTDAIKMELEGNWVDSKHGRQFQVNTWHELVPPTVEGILGYLSSGILKGIGPKTAGEIVQRFGTDALNVIEHHPERLLEIKGITEDKLEEIKAGYAESTAVRDLMTVLAPFKLTPKTAMKIYEHFGPDGAALLRKSFYQLCQISGFGCSRVVYVTEGALKADIAHALTGRTFVATVGVNNAMGMDELFAFLRRNGTEEIIEAEDMDKYCNPNVSRGASKVHQLAVKNGLKCRRLVWNPNYKGIDDWLLALHRKKIKEKERVSMNFKEMYLRGMCPFDYIESCAEQWRSRPDIGVSAEVFLGLTHEEYEMFLQMDPGASLKAHLDAQRRTQKFRVYQLDLNGLETCPFAFRGSETMLNAGYKQPPADSYQLVYDGEITYPKVWTERNVLEYIFVACNDDLPEGYQGRSLSMSDIVELYDGDNRDFFYCERCGFTPVSFDAEQAKPMREVDEDG